MNELAKIDRVISRNIPNVSGELGRPDGTTGQNAISCTGICFCHQSDRIILTKMDGTAKGGIAIAVRIAGIPSNSSASVRNWKTCEIQSRRVRGRPFL